MKEIDASKHTVKSLEFIFSEVDKAAKFYLNSLRQTTNKSFLLFAFASSVIGVSFNEVLKANFEYLSLILPSIICVILLIQNLRPPRVTGVGAMPETITGKYFDPFKDDELEKKLLVVQIHNYNDSIKSNSTTVAKMVKRIKWSFVIFIASFILFGVIALTPFIVEIAAW